MISNINYQELESLKLLVSFVEFVQNPEKFKTIVDEAKATIKEAKKVVEAYSLVEEAQIYLKNTKIIQGDLILELEEKNVLLDSKIQKAREEAKEQEEKFKKIQESLDTAKAQVIKKEFDLAEYGLSLQLLSAKVKDQETKLDSKENELQVKEQELNQKAAKLKELLG